MSQLFLTYDQRAAVDFHAINLRYFVRPAYDSQDTVWIDAKPSELYFAELGVPHTTRPGILGGTFVTLLD